MHGPGRALRRLTEGLLEVARQVVDDLNVGVHLGDGLIERRVIDLLVGVAIPGKPTACAR